ncbi:MAG: pentapeptide repeat-containing protein [Vampirovibrionales bacterium]
MRFASLSTPTYSTPRMAGLQAQASTANVAPQKAEAFTPPSGRIQRQGFKDETQVYQAIKAIETHLEKLTESPELWGRLKEVFRDEFGHTPQQAFQTHKANLQAQLEILQSQLDTGNYTGQGAYLVGLDFIVADLRWAQLQGADLRGAQFDRPDLQGAQLQGAQLQGADLFGAQLQGAQLQGADLRGAQMELIFGVPLGCTLRQLRQVKNPYTILPLLIRTAWQRSQEKIKKFLAARAGQGQ